MMTWLGVVASIALSACGATKDNADCGNGAIESGEQCDEGDANGSSCCTSECELVPTFTVCRLSVGECDAADQCDGESGACPDDATMPDGTPCEGNGEAACSLADVCSAGVCDNGDMSASSPCGGEATCNPDRCDGAGSCVDVAALADNAACADNGGTLCCGSACSVTGSTGTCNQCSGTLRAGLTIAIIESQSISVSQKMDEKWKAIADGLGHTATIQPQTFLDDVNNLTNVDILILTSHDILVPQGRRNAISLFVTGGKGVYIQSEFDPLVFEGNKVFETVVDSLGGTFTWGAQVQGQLVSNAAGCLANTPNTVIAGSINFGATAGLSTGIGTIVTGTPVGGSPTPVGFRFCRNGGGLVMTITDKDNINGQTAGVPELMKNIIFRLSHPEKCAP